MTFGAIQIPADRQPVLLMADSQTYGGYLDDRSRPLSGSTIVSGDSLSFVVVTSDKASVSFGRPTPDWTAHVTVQCSRLQRVL